MAEEIKQRISELKENITRIENNPTIASLDTLMTQAYYTMLSIDPCYVPRIAYSMFDTKRREYIKEDISIITKRYPSAAYTKKFNKLSDEEKAHLIDDIIEHYLPTDADQTNYFSERDMKEILRRWANNNH